MNIKTYLSYFSFLVLLSNLCIAAPVAMVEHLSDGVADVQLLDFLEPGRVVKLGEKEALSLGYLNSCIREKINGGIVTVGENQSVVDGGDVEREKLQCDGVRLILAANEAMHSGAMAFRALKKNNNAKLTVHDTSPILILPKGGKVVIKRIGQEKERHKLMLDANDSRVMLDLAKEAISLTPGATYMLSSSGKTLVFDIAKNAIHNPKNIVGRVIPL